MPSNCLACHPTSGTFVGRAIVSGVGDGAEIRRCREYRDNVKALLQMPHRSAQTGSLVVSKQQNAIEAQKQLRDQGRLTGGPKDAWGRRLGVDARWARVEIRGRSR